MALTDDTSMYKLAENLHVHLLTLQMYVVSKLTVFASQTHLVMGFGNLL